MRQTPFFCTLLALLTVASPAMVNAKPLPKAHSKPARPAAHKLVPLTPTQLARLVLPSVVRLTVLDASGQPSVQGLGFVVGPNLIATNVHVIRGAHAVTANFQNGRSETVHGFVAADSARDLVLLYANTNGVRALPLMTDNTVQVGDPVVAVGSPEGLGGSISTGIISQMRHDGDTKILQTTAPISHGSSGGALVDMYGRVLGVTSLSYTDGQNLNFAYAARYVQQLLPHGVPIYTSWAQGEEHDKNNSTQVATAPSTTDPPAEPLVPSTPSADVQKEFHRHYVLGVEYYNKGQYNLSQEEFKIAISLNPNRPDAHSILASAYSKTNDVKNEMAEYKIAADLEPSYTNCFVLGQVYYDSQKYTEAISVYETALRNC